jgi:hypothetical protein
MTSEKFEEWLKEVDRQMKRRQKKIAMIVDNCPAHPKVEKLEAIELFFLPPNTTSKTQLMDQGVIDNLKVHYRKKIVLRQIESIETKQEFQLTVLDALRLLKQAWDCVTATTIMNCFRHAGFLIPADKTQTSTDIDINDESDELDEIPLAKLAVLDNRIVLTDFIEFSETVPTTEQLTDDDIITKVLDSRRQHVIDDDDEDDDSEHIEEPTPDLNDVTRALNVCYRFFESRDNSESALGEISSLSRKVDKAKLDILSQLRQSSLLEFTELTSREARNSV